MTEIPNKPIFLNNPGLAADEGRILGESKTGQEEPEKPEAANAQQATNDLLGVYFRKAGPNGIRGLTKLTSRELKNIHRSRAQEEQEEKRLKAEFNKISEDQSRRAIHEVIFNYKDSITSDEKGFVDIAKAALANHSKKKPKTQN